MSETAGSSNHEKKSLKEREEEILMHDWRHGICWPGLTPCTPPPAEKRCYCRWGEMKKRAMHPLGESKQS
jgi:hypothetical protein